MNTSDAVRFWAKVEKTDGCWLWTSAVNTDGYGLFWLDGWSQRAHRVSWVIAGGDLDPALVLDHICRVRLCVRPDHLRQVTDRVNALAGMGPPAFNARRQRCSRGHPFDEQNTHVRRPGWRVCRACDRDRRRVSA